MGNIIKMIGSLLAGLGLASIVPTTDLSTDATTPASDVSNWSSIIALGGIGVGVLFWAMAGKKITKMMK